MVELGDLAPGQSVSISEGLHSGRATQGSASAGAPAGAAFGVLPIVSGGLPMEKLVGGSDYWSDKELNRRYQLLQALALFEETGGLLPQGVTFFAWTEESLWDVAVEDAVSEKTDTVVYFLELPFGLAGKQGELVIPPALTTWMPWDGRRAVDTGPYDFYLASGWISFQFQPWDVFQLVEVEGLALNVDSSSSLQGVQVALWDWSSETWVVDQSVGLGANTVQEATRFVGPNNAVRVRIENTRTSGLQIDVLDVTFKGVAP